VAAAPATVGRSMPSRRARPHRGLSHQAEAGRTSASGTRSASSSATLDRDRGGRLYVPGGTAAYPSSVLMNAVPAKVAGVPRVSW